jgi:hypothetical protein
MRRHGDQRRQADIQPAEIAPALLLAIVPSSVPRMKFSTALSWQTGRMTIRRATATNWPLPKQRSDWSSWSIWK